MLCLLESLAALVGSSSVERPTTTLGRQVHATSVQTPRSSSLSLSSATCTGDAALSHPSVNMVDETHPTSSYEVAEGRCMQR